jgi:hypothetical protein
MRRITNLSKRVELDAGFAQLTRQLGRVERKLDQFIDVQFPTNQLVDRRLRARGEQRPGSA